ncbi:hypothetical protein DH2020_019322 [Rehmannia glutinosa]|uniref:Phosphoglycerate mutase family protein n=1 Tax=Rehmannia glutinosa TaxID=99300 RepID=A0ABR0WQS4_REHGL
MLATTTYVASNSNPPNPAHKIPSSNSSFSSNSKPSHVIPINRRGLLTSLSVTLTPFLTSPQTKNHTHYADPVSLPVSEARGLFQMPPVRLTNRYYLVRAGESEYESLGIINTNPVAKTSVDNGLSEKGKKQTVRAALDLKSMGACESNCWIWPSITQRAYQAAEIIAAVNGITRRFDICGKSYCSIGTNIGIFDIPWAFMAWPFQPGGNQLTGNTCQHIVPEYSFLDARGLGAYEGKKLDTVSEVYASDSLSPNIKPPPIDDGTPNESVQDVFVRVTQLMSILETQYSEDTVIIVSPDSDNLTVLQAGLVGLELRRQAFHENIYRHRDLAFRPGEVRFVDANSIPTYKQPASAVYKCLNPPNCN